MGIYLINIFSLLLYRYFYLKCGKTKKAKKIIIALIVLQFSLIQGLRSFNVGIDTLKYVTYYEYVLNSNLNFITIITEKPFVFEIGYLELMVLCKYLNFSPRLFLILISFIINILIGRFIYHESKDFILSFWIFIGIEYFTLSFTMLRQMIAIGFVLNAYMYYKKHDTNKFMIFQFLAFIFHKTSLVFLLFIILEKVFYYFKGKINAKYFSLKYKWLVVILMYLLLIVFKPLIIYITKLFYGYYEFTATNIGTLWFVMSGILMLLFIIEYFYGSNKDLIQYQFIILLSSVIQFSVIYISHLSRGALYFYAFAIIILPNISDSFNIKYSKIFKMAVYLLTFAQYILFSLNIYDLVPYSVL